MSDISAQINNSINEAMGPGGILYAFLESRTHVCMPVPAFTSHCVT